MNDTISVNSKTFQLIKLLGKGKGGYSYLVTDGEKQYVLKQIHHEPCEYYSFGNKLEAELSDYNKLKGIGINIPRLYDCDVENERILKEYIEGLTVYEMILADCLPQSAFRQVEQMCALLYPSGTNIDFFPTNFVMQNGVLYYIDYECNDYMEKWNFENWGVTYWSKTEQFLEYAKNNNK